jgi:hypothetical protein
MVRDRNGRLIVEDGEVLKVPLFLLDSKMDSVQRAIANDQRIAAQASMNQRRKLTSASNKVSDAALTFRQGAFDGMVARLENAWKTPPTQQAAPSDQPVQYARPSTHDAALSARDAAYEGMLQRLENAWKAPPTQQAAPSDQPLRHARPPTHDAVLSARDAAYEDMLQRLRDAWRTA